ncbi:hypothetical protein [Sphingobacterium rhinopitheci]|uniref:hypothetical protein n=1 Tax=Sphingobacterium rhinopitheci TaxID=2781960 RepID=UPI001F51F45B|nr:hypothetical protein [Sphingobacterium rhinopitheci]MCI0920354.1 hypothetical protein [Sphingobacterium rhinopitheci]
MRVLFNLFNLGIGLLIASLNYSCFQDPSTTKEVVTDSLLQTTNDVDSLEVPLWEYDANNDSMIKNHIPSQLTTEIVLNDFNNRYEGTIHLDLLRIGQDTIFLTIKDANYLTHHMGTTGAFAFMAELVYSLTEVSSIEVVNLEFEEGDHASPGAYRRADFDNYL